VGEVADSLSYWTFTEVFEEGEALTHDLARRPSDVWLAVVTPR
jgi:hypothetical protein